eukprot:gene31713-biopygen6566
MANFLELLEGHSQGHWTLAPEGTVQHFSTDAWKLLNPGDHVVVMIGGWRRGYAHHGIVISPYGPGQDPQVAHFVSPTGDMLMRDARLQIGSHTEFIGARATFGIVPYASANSEAEKFERQRAVDLAKWMVESPEFARKKYNLIAWNCECFAWIRIRVHDKIEDLSVEDHREMPPFSCTFSYKNDNLYRRLIGDGVHMVMERLDPNIAKIRSAAVKSAYDSAVSASNQTYGIGSLDSNGDILLRGNLRISETANIYKGTEVFSSGGMNIDGYSWNYLANYVIPRRVYPKPLTNTESAYLFTGAAQDHSACVRNGELFVYGRNDYGQLGLGHTSNTITVPTKVPGINNASLVACGEGFTLCVRTDGTAISTGLNDNGQLGIGSDANGQLGRGASSANVVINSNIVPMLMPDGSNVPARSISAGGDHSAVLLNNGSAYLCGKNDQGQCGASTTLVPQANSLGIISSLSNVVDVACGHEHTLFTCYDGQVLGVGRNNRGQLGQGNKTSPVTSVVQVLAGGGAGSKNGLSVEIAAGFNHSALIKNDSTIFVFGANDKGHLGLGETTTESLTPTQLVGYAGYDIACGRNHTVISTTPDPLVFNFTGNNALIAFGDNAYGQIAAGTSHAASIDGSGSIITCGHNGLGQLGNNTTSAGQHRCFVDALAPARLRDHEGLVVVTDKNAYASGLLRGRQRAMTIIQALPLVSLSKVPKDPRAFGVISLTQDHPAGPSAAISGTELLRIAEQGDVRVQINSIGEGCIWVCVETGSTIHAGDYVTTSSLSGYASLQVLDDGDVPDGTLRNYTVAKLTMDCDFSQPLVDVEEVQKDEYGNVVFDADGSLVYTIVTTTQGPSVVDPDTGETRTGEPLKTPIPVTEPSYEMRWMTTEIDASGVSITTLISKEDYEKRTIGCLA